MIDKLKKSSIVAVVVFTLLICALIFGLLYLTSMFLISRFDLQGIEPYVGLSMDMVKHGVKFQKLAGLIGCLVSFGLPIAFFASTIYSILHGEKRELHGSAKLATRNDLVKAGLLEPDKSTRFKRFLVMMIYKNQDDTYPSIIVGITDDGCFLLFRGMQFVMLAAETRSGKGVGIVIPNLLHYRDSVVILDFKGENFAITSGFRKKCGQEVYRFSPDNENFETDCWNPLDYVRDDEVFRLSDLLSITNMLYPPAFDNPWSSTAENLFLGIALYILDTAKERDNFNIPCIKKMAVTLPFLKDEETFDQYVKSREPFEPLSEDAIVYLKAFAQTSDKVRNSIMISFNQPLGVFGDPITAKATSKSTFDLRDVRKKRMSIYVVIQPGNIGKYGTLLNLFFQQLLTENMRKLPSEDPSLKYQCLLLLDEFPAMGRIPIIEKASAYMAGYNMRLLLVFQNKSQIRDNKLYGPDGAETIMGNMALQIIFAPRKDNEAKEYSEMIGYMTWKGKSTSGKKHWLGGSIGDNETVSDQRRAVLLPQEIKDIGQDAAIISMSNMKPAKVKKIRWYEEPIFQARANLECPKIPVQALIENSIQRADSYPISRFEGLSTKQALSSGASFEVGFSPKRNALEVVMSLIMNSEKELLVAAYSFTSQEIAYALAEAKGRGVDVRVVVDDEQNTDEQGGYNAVDFLVSKSIPVKRITNYAAMHHKFMVSDQKHIQLGSFNYTKSANLRNAETAIAFMDAPELATIYRTEWLRLNEEPEVSTKNIEMLDRGLEFLKELEIL